MRGVAYLSVPEKLGRVRNFYLALVATRPEGRSLLGEFPFTATPRVLTYTTKDVIDKRISVPAQHSLVRLSKNPATSADAIGMLEEVKAGRLGGIYCVNWEKPAQRALRLGKSWWTVIPPSEDAVLMLDPDNMLGGQPLIAFRRELDPDCGLLKGEKRFAVSPSKLDAALLKAWASHRLWQTGQLAPFGQALHVPATCGGPGNPICGTRSIGSSPMDALVHEFLNRLSPDPALAGMTIAETIVSPLVVAARWYPKPAGPSHFYTYSCTRDGRLVLSERKRP